MPLEDQTLVLYDFDSLSKLKLLWSSQYYDKGRLGVQILGDTIP